MKRHTIIFWGPIAQNSGPIGGGESGNRRTISHLFAMGYNVIEVPKPYPPKFFFRPIIFLAKLLFTVGKFVYKCGKFRSYAIAHISGYYNHLIYFELALLAGSKIFHIPCVYEIRGGAMLTAYQNRSFVYRKAFNLMLLHADAILIQGEEYRNFIEAKTHIKPVYYPNFVNDSFLDIQRNQNNNLLNLIYFGRITEDKGIFTTLNVCLELVKAGLKVKLSIIGDGSDIIIHNIQKFIETKKLQDNISVIPPIPQPKLLEYLKKSHFFIFPTTNPMEGHSNALTEAMAVGVVPICSNQGFNTSVVDECGMVLPKTAKAPDYANTILKIWIDGNWEDYSKKCRKRVAEFYNSSTVVQSLIHTYQQFD